MSILTNDWSECNATRRCCCTVAGGEAVQEAAIPAFNAILANQSHILHMLHETLFMAGPYLLSPNRFSYERYRSLALSHQEHLIRSRTPMAAGQLCIRMTREAERAKPPAW